MVASGEINQNTAKTVLAAMFNTGKPAAVIVRERGLRQISDSAYIAGLVNQVLNENPEQVREYLQGKVSIARWLFGQVMGAARGQANPKVLENELQRQLEYLQDSNDAITN
jgi:aspartyl-tRNA(Asn)/glutamyl-tRNA(Gln) amidotransferase subunit B